MARIKVALISEAMTGGIYEHVRQILVDFHITVALVLLELGLYSLDRLLRDSDRADAQHIKGLLVTLHPRERQEVVNQSAEPFVLVRGSDHRKLFLTGVRLSGSRTGLPPVSAER